MENKKVSLSTIFLVIAIILIGVMGYMMYQMNSEIKQLSEKVANTEKTTANDTVIENSKDVEEYTEITKELEGIDVLFVTDAIENSNNTYTLKGVIYTQYTISPKELSDILDKGAMTIESEVYTIKRSDNAGEYDLFEKDNENALYKLKMLNSKEYYLETQAQVADNWKLTNEYKEITVSKDTKCSIAFDYEEKYNTVDDVFKNFEQTKPIETKNPDVDKTFTFKFENGKCVEVISAITGV